MNSHGHIPAVQEILVVRNLGNNISRHGGGGAGACKREKHAIWLI